MIKKIIICSILLLELSNICYGEFWDILYVKYPYTPILNSPWEDNSVVLYNLQKWYIVLDQWENWDYINVKLTDNNIWYILKVLLENNSLSKYKIWGNYWKIIKNTFLSEKPAKWNKKNILIYKWTTFKILHVNYINNNYIKVKINNWKYKNKVWFIYRQYAEVYNIEWFKNEISIFIEKNSKVKVELNSAEENKGNNWDDLINSLNDIFNEQNTQSTDTTSTNNSTQNSQTTNNTTNNSTEIPSAENSEDLINSLNSLFE